MLILYYCPEYSSQKRGGSTHAREFLSALRRHPDVEKADVWPEVALSDEATEKKPPKRVTLEGKLRQFIRCFKPRYQLTYDLCRVLDGGNYDSLIIRVASHRNLLLKKIKDKFPSLSIFLEVNALRLYNLFSFRTLDHYPNQSVGCVKDAGSKNAFANASGNVTCFNSLYEITRRMFRNWGGPTFENALDRYYSEQRHIS